MPIWTPHPYDGASGSFPVRVQEVAVTSDRHAPQGAAGRSGNPAHEPADHLTGRVLDNRYLVGSRVARGGMATVYEATDLRLDRTVAVKVMHPGLGDDDEFAARFVAEARAAAKLSHPNVVAVFDQGNDDGTVFLAMELIPGHTLRDTIGKEAPLSPARALALLEPVVSALANAHRAGLIHRDVKPENVLIADDGRVKVADFGLAKAMSATTQHTATGVLIGTVSYVAPELVVEGRSDARADVYAVGVILYELLTGKKPHEGETPTRSPTSTSTRTSRHPRASRPASLTTSTRWWPAPPPATASSGPRTPACSSTTCAGSTRPSPPACAPTASWSRT
jgi:serine/threonine protein kinase